MSQYVNACFLLIGTSETWIVNWAIRTDRSGSTRIRIILSDPAPKCVCVGEKLLSKRKSLGWLIQLF